MDATKQHRVYYIVGFIILLIILSIGNPSHIKASSTSWEGTVYNNIRFEGNGVSSGSFEKVNFDWGNDKSPAPGIAPNTAFSAVYQRTVNVEQGVFNLIARGNGGIRVYVDNHLYINKWTDTGERQIHTHPINLSGGEHTIRIEFKETAGEANLEFVLDDLLRDNRWYGVAFPNTSLTGDQGTLVGYNPQLPNINFDWGNDKSPAPGIAPNTAFSAVYQRTVKIEHSGSYSLIVKSNGGVRVYVDGNIVLDYWNGSEHTETYRRTINLPEGNHDIKLQYKNISNNPNLHFKLVSGNNPWIGYIYPNTNLNGDSFIEGYSNKLEFNLGNNKSPTAGIRPNTAFSGIYKKEITVNEGAYNLIVRANGGIRVLVDGQVYIDKWTDTGRKQNLQQAIFLNKGKHTIQIEYLETAGEANLEFVLDSLKRDNKWYGVVFPNTSFSGKGKLVGYSPQILNLNFDWGNDKSPAPGIAPNTAFTAVYQKKVNVGSGNYFVSVYANGGVQVYVDGVLKINKWNDTGSEQIFELPFYLEKGSHDLMIKFIESAGEASITASFGKYDNEKNYYTTNYDYNLKHMVDAQMKAAPQTDLTNGQGWKTASRNQVEYYTNPTNFPAEGKNNFQFLILSRPIGLNSVDAKIINNEFLDNAGILSGRAQAFINGGNKYNVNEIYLISHALLETGNGTSTLAQGISTWTKRTPDGDIIKDKNGNPVIMDISPKKVYNMFGIGAYDSCPYDCGAQRAYDNGWFTPDVAITEGAAFASRNYINDGQDTLYEMRWNPAHLENYSYASHQYASDVGWAVKQTNNIYAMYSSLVGTYSLMFEVPHFIDQQKAPGGSREWQGNPGTITNYPGGVFGVTDTGSTPLNFRELPTTRSTEIADIPNGTKLEIIATNGTWLKVIYNGKTGWVHGNYVNLLNLLEVTATNLNVRTSPNGTSLGKVSNVLMTAVLDSKNNMVKDNEWYQVYFKGQKAWISDGDGSYIDEVK